MAYTDGAAAPHARKHNLLSDLDHFIDTSPEFGLPLVVTSENKFGFAKVGPSGVDGASSFVWTGIQTYEVPVLFAESVDWGLPSSGYGYLYASTTGKMSWKDDAGTVFDLTIADETANYIWTGTHRFDAGLTMGDGQLYDSDVTNAAQDCAHDFDTPTLTQAFASSANPPTDARLIARFSTSGTDKFNLYAKGTLHIPEGGIYQGALHPYDALTNLYQNYWLANANAASAYINLAVVVQQNAASFTGNQTGCSYDVRVKGNSAGTKSATVYGGRFSVNYQAQTNSDNYNGGAAGGEFTVGHNLSAIYSGGALVGIATCGRFTYYDRSLATTTNTVGDVRYCEVSIDASSTSAGYNVAVNRVTGFHVPDITVINPTTSCDAMRVLEPTANPAATWSNVRFEGGDWNTGHVQLGAAHVWFDPSGTLRGKVTAPTSTSDGTDILGGLGDGDKGDVTVSAAGATWTVDADISKTWTGDHLFQGGSGGDYTVAGDIDVTIGVAADYGLAQVGKSVFGRTSRVTGLLDLDGTVILANQGTPATSNILFAMMDGTNSIRFALPQSAVGNATYNPRSMLIAGPAPINDTCVTVGYWQGVGIFDNLACDTSGSGADLGVQNDLEVEGTIYADTIAESTTAAGVTVDGLLIKDGDIPSFRGSKSITIESPTSSEDTSMFFVNQAVTITEIRAVVRGTTPSVTWTVRHGTDRSATGAEAVTGGTTTTSQSTGSDVTTFNDATIVADSFVWIETTAASGTVNELHVTVLYSED